MKCIVYVLAFIALIAAAAEVNPGLRTTISNDALDYLRKTLQPVLIEEVKTAKIPDMSDDVSHVHIYLTDIKLSEFNLEKSSVVLSTPNFGTLSLSGISVHLNMNWRYNAHIAKDHGTAEVHTSGASTSIKVALARNPKTGAPAVTVTDTGFDCGDFDIKMHGGASWLYNMIIKSFKGKIRDSINKAVREKMQDTINQMVTKALATVPMSVDFGNGISLCYELADDPAVIPDYGKRFVAGSVAESYITKEGRGKSGFKPTAMPKTTATSAPGPMLEIFINDFAINTLSYSYVNSGNTHMIIDDKNAPAEAKPLLVSGYYVSAAPGLVKKYGTDAPLRMDFEVGQVPTLYMQPDGFQLKTAGMLTMEVNESNTFTKVIGMNLNILVAGSVVLKNTTIIPHLDVLNVTCSIASSSVGEVDPQGMQDLIDFTTTYATSELNDKFANGIPLPVVKGLTFVDPKIVWGSNYLAIASSFSYKP